MMTLPMILGVALIASGAGFFVAGTAGLLRFPDAYSRLHALTKVDNLGLGLVVLGLACLSDSWAVVGKLVLIWALVLASSATAACLVARDAWRQGVTPSRGAARDPDR